MKIVSALDLYRYNDCIEIYMRVWFEEYNGWLPFIASPFDCERHGKELWIRAMAGEYGSIELRPRPTTALPNTELQIFEPMRTAT